MFVGSNNNAMATRSTFKKQEFNEEFDHTAGVREMFAQMGYSEVKVKAVTSNGCSLYVSLNVAVLNKGRLYAEMFTYEDLPVTITVRISDHASGLSRAGVDGNTMTMAAFKHLITTGAIASSN